MFGNLFKKDEPNSETKPVSQSKSLFDTYISTKKEIDYLEHKHVLIPIYLGKRNN